MRASAATYTSKRVAPRGAFHESARQLPEAAQAYAAGLAKAKDAGLREKLHYKLGWVQYGLGAALPTGAPFTYDDAGQAYNFTTTQLQGAHSLSFAVPGRASETLSLSVPGAVTVSSPSPNRGTMSTAKPSFAPCAAR